MQPFQCDLQPQLQETHRTTHTGTTTRCRTQRRNQSRPERPQPQPPHRRGTFHRRLQPLYTEKHKVSCSGFLPKTKPMQHSCSHSNAICIHRFKKRIELRTQEQPLVVRNDRSRTRRTDEVPFIAGCNHFTRKNARFRSPASSPKLCPCNIHAAIPMRSATTASRNAQNYAHRNNHSLQNTEEEPIASGTTAAATAAQTRYLSSPAATTLHGKTQGFVLRLPPQNFAHATFMQPFQCDLQPQLQETHRTTHTGTTTRCRTQRRNQSRPERPQPQPPHRQGTFHRRLQPLYTEKHMVSCSGFLPKTLPMQHSCGHSNAICIHSFKKRIELRTQEQPLVAEHRGGTNRVRNDRSRNRRTDEVPFIASCNHFTRKNTRFRAPASSPKQSPCNIHAAIPMRSATTASRNAQNYAHRNNHSLQNTEEEPIASGTIAACSHFTRKNTRFRAPASSPKLCPCNIHAAIPMRSAATAWRNA